MNFKCPFHNDKNASLSFKNNFFKCYGCKNYGILKNNFLIKNFNIYFDFNIIKQAKKNLYIKKNYWLKYLLLRNINMKISLEFDLGYLDFTYKKKINNILLNRLIFPIFNEKNILESIGVKTTQEKNKYLIFTNNKNNLNFYGISKIKNFDFILVVEGYFDLLTIKKNFFKNVIAILGSNITNFQFFYLIKKFKKIYFCFDGDEAGYNACYNLKKKYFFLKKNVFFKTLPYNYDPDNYIKKFGFFSFINYLKK